MNLTAPLSKARQKSLYLHIDEKRDIRRLLGSFRASDPYDEHVILVFEAAQMRLCDMKLV